MTRRQGKQTAVRRAAHVAKTWQCRGCRRDVPLEKMGHGVLCLECEGKA